MSLSPIKRAGTDRPAHDVAAEWLLREESGRISAGERTRLDHWLDADPIHRTAWDEVHMAVATVSANAADPELMAMRAAALSARAEQGGGAGQLIAATVAALAIVGAGYWGLRPAIPPLSVAAPAGQPVMAANPNTAVYRTAVGERSSIALPDGSVATLDTDSELRVAYTGAERGVRLVRGQALFDVAKHKPIPFEVYAGDRRITAVGTRFNVRLDGAGSRSRVSVALLEGVIQVARLPSGDGGAPVQSLTMAAGEVLEADAAAPVRVTAGDTDRLASWRSGVLSFDDAPLADAVAEMNRYNIHPISLADPKLAALRVSGVFKTGDPDHFAETMSEVFPVRIEHDDAGDLVLAPRG